PSDSRGMVEPLVLQTASTFAPHRTASHRVQGEPESPCRTEHDAGRAVRPAERGHTPPAAADAAPDP
ncbi:hypothetical protein ABZ990_31035, partial [Streptomyces sp. NPDC046203]|uniref:hypothetical protein n=1 Tax=Streptomyces sp. NPDC046203 TaxID=3154602 RepID=UPI0033E04D96